MAAFIQIDEQLGTDLKAGVVSQTTRGLQGETLARLCEANIDAGLGVVDGASPGVTSKAPASAAEVADLLGVTMDPEFHNEIGAAADYLAGDQISILEEGRIPVVVEGAVALTDEVFCRHTSDGGSYTTLGTFRADAGAAAAASIVLDVGAAADAQEGQYTLRLFNGVSEATFAYTTDGSALASEVIAAFVSQVNAHADYAATGTTEVTITRATGNRLEVREFSGPNQTAQDALSITDNQQCALVPRAGKFKSTTAADGVATIRLGAK